jgi:hypothetical protein
VQRRQGQQQQTEQGESRQHAVHNMVRAQVSCYCCAVSRLLQSSVCRRLTGSAPAEEVGDGMLNCMVGSDCSLDSKLLM